MYDKSFEKYFCHTHNIIIKVQFIVIYLYRSINRKIKKKKKPKDIKRINNNQ